MTIVLGGLIAKKKSIRGRPHAAKMEAMVQDIIVNSPLVHRRSRRPQESPIKFLVKQTESEADDETEKHKNNNNRRKNQRIRNFFGGMITSVRNVMHHLITSPLDNSIPLMDCVAARGESHLVMAYPDRI